MEQLKNKNRYLHYFKREIIEHKVLQDRLHLAMKMDCVYETRTLPDIDGTNKIIFDAIVAEKPFALVRPGNGELGVAIEWEEIQLFGKRLFKRRGQNWQIHANIFGEENIDKYNQMFRRDLSDADILSVFSGSILEEYIAERYCPNAEWIHMAKMGPYNSVTPWTDALKGKKVLVVSQFSDFLQEQYEKRDSIYNGKWQWPEFELIPVRSVWFFPDEKDKGVTWFDKLDCLYDEVMKHDFDIAILSCGAFGINLAPMIKRAGKQAIQYGGELQMLFGIRGARWDDHPLFTPYYNDSWIRVSRDEVGLSMENANSLDDGCYW